MLGMISGFILESEFSAAGPQAGLPVRFSDGVSVKAPGVYLARGADGEAFLIRFLAPCQYTQCPPVFRELVKADLDSMTHHPGQPAGLLPIYGSLSPDGVVALVYRWEPTWITLRQRLASVGGGLSQPEALTIMLGAARALRPLHRTGVPHTQLRPENILLAPEKKVLLADLGLHRGWFAASPGPALPPALAAAAYPYLAPELLDDAVGMTPAADIWSVGVMLFEMVTGNGKLPYIAVDRADRYEWRDAAVSVIGCAFPGPLQRVVRACLSVDPAQRYPDAERLHTELDRVMMELYPPTVRITPPAPPSAQADKQLQCKVCGATFLFTVSQQQHHARKHWPEPKRCKACRPQRQGNAGAAPSAPPPPAPPPAPTPSAGATIRLDRYRVMGTIRKVHPDGYGFITAQSGEAAGDIFFHAEWYPEGLVPYVGQPVSFLLVYGKNGKPQAREIQVMES